MFPSKNTHRLRLEVNAGSMADIAFLLLIFFLVTTTILSESGIIVRLPIWDENPINERVNQDNVLTIKINSANQLLVEGEQADLKNLRFLAKDFIMNPQQLSNRPEIPAKAIISLQNDRGTSYETYLTVYNELKAASRELWREEALRQFGMDYEKLKTAQQQEVRNKIPFTISEAEPTEF